MQTRAAALMLLHLSLFVCVLSIVARVNALPTGPGLGCGTRDFDPSIDLAHERSLLALREEKEQQQQQMEMFNSFRQFKRPRVPVHWHVIRQRYEHSEYGTLYDPTPQIHLQMQVLQRDYDNIVEFTLGSINLVDDLLSTVLVQGSVSEYEAKKKHRKGGRDALNVYLADTAPGNFGYSSFPQDYDPALDGIVLLRGAIANGTIPSHNTGAVLTHEVGHWLGLYHTFQGGCSFPNDFVQDTRPQRKASRGCPMNIKSCSVADFSGTADIESIQLADLLYPYDSVHNFMDYSIPDCMGEFTAGQKERILQSWSLRSHLV